MTDNLRNKTFSFLFLVIFISSSLIPFILENSKPSIINNVNFPENMYQDLSDFTNKIDNSWSIENDRSRFPYKLFESEYGSGNTFNIMDYLSFNHPFELNLTKLTYSSANSENFYSIDQIAGYSQSLKYNITSITAIAEYIDVESSISGGDGLADGEYLAIVQGFEIISDYANFVGTDIFLDITGIGSLGNYSLDLFLIKDEGVYPDINNMSKILSNDTDSPYDIGNIVPSALENGLTFYDFNDVILSKGKYFVVANLSTIDTSNPGQSFEWKSKNGAPFGGKSYRYDENTLVWENVTESIDYTLMPKIQPLNSSKQPMTYTPDEINLTDNLVAIQDVDQSIIDTGRHNLTSTVSVNIKFNNSYSFNKLFYGSSAYQANNASHSDYSTSWNISWDIDLIDFNSYTNPNRMHRIITPNDWDDSSFTFILDTSIPLIGQKELNGYSCDLSEVLSGNTYEGGNLVFSSHSPNYLYETTLTDGITETDTFDLGYWTYNDTHSIGHEGSAISADIFIKDTSLVDITTGTLNFTLFDPNGNIIPLKTQIYANLAYFDTSNYTLLTSTQISPGQYELSTSIDPSIYGTDIEGYWTAAYHWNNGTEVGFFSKRITLIKETEAIFEWEELPANGEWYNNSLQDIRRINGHDINIRVAYYNISDPFFIGYGTLISGGEVSFSTNWGDSGNLVFDSPYYEYSIPTDCPPSDHFIDIEAKGQFLENHTINFAVKILHQFTIENLQTDYYTNYTNEAIIKFRVLDVSNSSVPVLPDNMIFSHNGTSIDSADYSTIILSDNTIEITFETALMLLSIDSHDIGITISKAGFIASYTENDAESSVSLSILPIVTEIEIVNSVSSINYNNQTTVSFRLIDTNHSTHLTGANFEIHADIEGVEITSHGEEAGLYFFVLTVHEPSLSSVNIFLNVTLEGYVSKQNYLLTSIGITPGSTQTSTLPPDEGAPVYMYILIALFAAVIIGGSTFYTVQRRRSAALSEKKEIYKHINSIYQSVISLKKLIVVHTETSLPIFEMDFSSEIVVDPSLISGFLQAVSTIGGEMVGKESGGVKRIEYQDLTVTSTLDGRFIIHTFSDGELYELIESRLLRIVQWFSLMFGSTVEEWDGSTEIFRLNKEGIAEKIMGEIFLWLFYPLVTTNEGVENLENMSALEKRIFTFMVENGSSTMSRIIDILDDLELEETLIVLFDLVDKGYIKPDYTAYDIVTIRL